MPNLIRCETFLALCSIYFPLNEQQIGRRFLNNVVCLHDRLPQPMRSLVVWSVCFLVVGSVISDIKYGNFGYVWYFIWSLIATQALLPFKLTCSFILISIDAPRHERLIGTDYNELNTGKRDKCDAYYRIWYVIILSFSHIPMLWTVQIESAFFGPVERTDSFEHFVSLSFWNSWIGDATTNRNN